MDGGHPIHTTMQNILREFQIQKGLDKRTEIPDLGFQNLLVHREIEAKKGLEDFPFIDIMYTDFPEIFLEVDLISNQATCASTSRIVAFIKSKG